MVRSVPGGRRILGAEVLVCWLRPTRLPSICHFKQPAALQSLWTHLVPSYSMVSKPECDCNYLESLLKSLSSNPRVCDSVSLRWSLRICISKMFPGDVDGAGRDYALKNRVRSLMHNFSFLSYVTKWFFLVGSLMSVVSQQTFDLKSLDLTLLLTFLSFKKCGDLC